MLHTEGPLPYARQHDSTGPRETGSRKLKRFQIKRSMSVTFSKDRPCFEEKNAPRRVLHLGSIGLEMA